MLRHRQNNEEEGNSLETLDSSSTNGPEELFEFDGNTCPVFWQFAWFGRYLHAQELPSVLKLPKAAQIRQSAKAQFTFPRKLCEEAGATPGSCGFEELALLENLLAQKYECRLTVMNAKMNFESTYDTPFQRHIETYCTARITLTR